MMQICNMCGSVLERGICPHCGAITDVSDHTNILQCRSEAAECLTNKKWAEAEVWVLKGYECDPKDRQLQVAELLALTEGLSVIPSNQDTGNRVRELLKNLGKEETLRHKRYDLDRYRSRLRSCDLSTEPLSIGWTIAGILLGIALLALVVFLLMNPKILAPIFGVILIGWLICFLG